MTSHKFHPTLTNNRDQYILCKNYKRNSEVWPGDELAVLRYGQEEISLGVTFNKKTGFIGPALIPFYPLSLWFGEELEEAIFITVNISRNVSFDPTKLRE